MILLKSNSLILINQKKKKNNAPCQREIIKKKFEKKLFKEVKL